MIEAKFEHTITLDDLGGRPRVNYARYLEWYERGHVAALAEAGIQGFDDLFEKYGVSTFVPEVRVRYFRPLVLGDCITVATEVLPTGRSMGSSFKYHQELTCQGNKVSEADMAAVVVDSSGRPIGIPEVLRKALQLDDRVMGW